MNQAPIRIDLQNEGGVAGAPSTELLETWVRASLQQPYKRLEQAIRIVDAEESRQLNLHYRGIDKPTNILSFPAEPCEWLEYDYLGDLVID